ncbi:MAG: type IV toxin-antitoxin system AbiEi family antitoxin domain-containing protein [Micrococcaceae bacterium]
MATLECNKALDLVERMPQVFSYAEAIKAGFNKPMLKQLVDDFTLFKPGRGVYIKYFETDGRYHAALAVQKIHPEAVMCCYSSLYEHNVIDDLYPEPVFALPSGTKATEVFGDKIKFVHYPSKTFNLGIEIVETDDQKIRVYSVERSIIDVLISGDNITALTALRNFIREGNSTLELKRMAKEFPKVTQIIYAVLDMVGVMYA